MAQTTEQQNAMKERVLAHMNEPFVPVHDRMNTPSAEERGVQALEYIAYQLFEIRKALEK